MLTRPSMLAAICVAAVAALAQGQEPGQKPGQKPCQKADRQPAPSQQSRTTKSAVLPKPGKAAEIVFVGNSLTSFHDLPAFVRALGRNDRPARKLTTVLLAPGGYTLRQHLEFPHEPRPADEIRKRRPTYVVLQEQSSRPLADATLMENAARRFTHVCRQSRSVPVWYMTFAKKHQPHLQARISAQYEKVHRLNGGLLAPVGRAWQLLRCRQPQLELHMQDRVHPSKKGTYLTACVLYGTMFGSDVAGFPDKLTTTDRHGRTKVLIELHPTDGRRLRTAAAKALKTQALKTKALKSNGHGKAAEATARKHR